MSNGQSGRVVITVLVENVPGCPKEINVAPAQMYPCFHRVVLGLSLVLLCLSCGGSAVEPSACDGLGDKLVGITRDDYAPCAGEILASLEELEQALRRMLVEAETEARPEAEAAYKRLRHLMRQVDFHGDLKREVRAQSPALRIERWPDGNMSYFNREVGVAAAQFMSALRRPNEGNIQEGSRRHEMARRAYAYFR
jgi:hypothetical protein